MYTIWGAGKENVCVFILIQKQVKSFGRLTFKKRKIYINIYLLLTSYTCSYFMCVIHAHVMSAHAFFFVTK